MFNIRPAESYDIASITEIYNEAILKTTATFDTEPKTVDDQKLWFESHGPDHPVLVAEAGGNVIGWAALSPWSGRCAYEGTVEVSLYVNEKDRGTGIGRALLDAVLAEGKHAGIHTILARIADGNEISVRLHESSGFFLVGIMKEVGRKFGRLLDVHLMQKILD